MLVALLQVAAWTSWVEPRHPTVTMSRQRTECGVMWDVDGTLVESTTLAFTATNEVLRDAGHQPVSVEQYKIGCRYTTPERFNYHIGAPTGSADGARLGAVFDETYVKRVSRETAGLFDGMGDLLRRLDGSGYPLGVLSNACGEYVRAVVAANDELRSVKAALGADEVPAAKPHGDGLRMLCDKCAVDPAASIYVGDAPSDGQAARSAGMRSIGVLWGANGEAALRGQFDVVVPDVDGLGKALDEMLE